MTGHSASDFFLEGARETATQYAWFTLLILMHVFYVTTCIIKLLLWSASTHVCCTAWPQALALYVIVITTSLVFILHYKKILEMVNKFLI